jgi:hypothetical protein
MFIVPTTTNHGKETKKETLPKTELLFHSTHFLIYTDADESHTDGCRTVAELLNLHSDAIRMIDGTAAIEPTTERSAGPQTGELEIARCSWQNLMLL